MDYKILNALQKDAKITTKALSSFTGKNEDAITKEIDQLEKDGVICGYHAFVNWEKTDRELTTALIEVKVAPSRGRGFDAIAERIYRFDEVKSVYLMSGGYDLTVIIEGKSLKEISLFVSDKLSTMESVLSTATHFVMKTYKDHGVVMSGDNTDDDRLVVSP